MEDCVGSRALLYMVVMVNHQHLCQKFYSGHHYIFSELSFYLTLYIMSQKSHNLKFKGKGFVSVIGQFHFAMSTGNTELLSPLASQWFVTVFSYSLLFSHFSNMHGQCHFWKCHISLLLNTVKQAHHVHFPDAAVPNELQKSTVSLLAEFL